MNPDIRAFENSKIYSDAQNLFSEFEHTATGEELSEEQYLLTRNFLMLNLLINNGQRVGALVNLKLRHIKNAEDKDNAHVAVISQHKTGHISPITLVISNEMWKFLNIFLSSIRPRLPGFHSELEEEKSPVFLTYPSKTDSPAQLTPSAVDKAIKSIWKGAHQTKHLSATQLRKAAATSVRSKFPLARDMLASQMNHRPTTQDSYYLLTQKKAEAVKITRVIQNVMRNVNAEVREIEGESCEGPIIEEVEDTLALPEGCPQDHKRRLFSKEEASTIVARNKDLIDDLTKPIKNKQVIERLEETEEGRSIVERIKEVYPDSYGKRIADRVRTE